MGDLKPRLEGFAHRFTLLLPILSETGDAVFSELQCSYLFRLFELRFEGFLANTAEGHPPWFGSWLPPGAQQPVIDRHIQIVVWTAPVDEAKLFFKYLKAILRRPDVAGREIVVIEHTTVWMVEAADPPFV